MVKQLTLCVLHTDTHILLGMTWLQLGKTQAGTDELRLARKQVENHFAKKLEISGSESGLLAGWLTARVLLREAEELSSSHREHAQ